MTRNHTKEKQIRVFISYSWDSEEHRNSVKQMIGDPLRNIEFDVVADFYEDSLDLGEHIPTFMFRGINEADRVLIVCTPNYVYKANKNEGGVASEGLIISGEIAEDTGTKKFIPVFMGEKIVLPEYLKGRKGVDFRTEESIKNEFEKLVRSLKAGNIDSEKYPITDPLEETVQNSDLESEVDDMKNVPDLRIENHITIFNVGDVVVLKSGGPKMTIDLIEDNTAYCNWFINGASNRQAFALESLTFPKKQTSINSLLRS